VSAGDGTTFSCYRKTSISIERCDIQDGFDTYTVEHYWPPPPLSPPSPPAPPPSQTLKRINGRFLSGHPTADLGRAGVLVHQSDHQQGHWPWEATWGRLAATMVNARAPWMFSTSAIGFVIDPEVAKDADIFHCAYDADGNSMNSDDWGCAGSMPDLQHAMQEQERRAAWCNQAPAWRSCACAWGATAEDRSGCQYNEIVLWGDRFEQKLPDVVEAIFYPINGRVDTWEGSAAGARDAHKAFALQFNRPDLKLLTFDVPAARRGDAPWELAQ